MKRPLFTIRGYGISLSAQFFLWPLVLFAALLFAQSLKMAVSYMLFVFVLLMPLGAVLQLVLAYFCLQVSVRTEEHTIEKHASTAFTAIVSNSSILPFPFVEAELMLPDEKGIGCVPHCFVLSLHPLSYCKIERKLKFSFRGEYTVGIQAIRVCDCFRTVRLYIPSDKFTSLFVLPRRFELSPRESMADSELETQFVMRAKGTDNTELSDTRAYISGDSLKSIHWKLSSKSEDLIVKDYSRNKGSSVCILCDLEPHFAVAGEEKPTDTPLPEYADIIDMLSTDLVVETCIACALRELHAGNDVLLMWLQDGIPNAVKMHTLHDFEAFYRQFATAPLDTHSKQMTTLASARNRAENVSFVFVTAYLDAAATVEYTTLALRLGGGTSRPPELLYCQDPSLFTEDPTAKKQQTDRILELERAGITVTSIART